jgi:transcriptional regulator with XRE-family HTH domain
MDGQAIKATFGKNVKFLRFRKEYSQAGLAEKADISIIFLSNIERGVKFPKPEVMSRIAKALEVDVFELFKADLLPVDDKEAMSRLSEDIHRNINMAVDEVFKQYLG